MCALVMAFLCYGALEILLSYYCYYYCVCVVLIISCCSVTHLVVSSTFLLHCESVSTASCVLVNVTDVKLAQEPVDIV